MSGDESLYSRIIDAVGKKVDSKIDEFQKTAKEGGGETVDQVAEKFVGEDNWSMAQVAEIQFVHQEERMNDLVGGEMAYRSGSVAKMFTSR